MWLFLSVWTFNFICTLTALLMVWTYEIAAPVSWVLVVPSLAFDIWRLATPNDYAEDGPHHPIWHSPNTVFWIYLAFCILALLLAPLFRYSCFEEFNRMVEPYTGFANRKLVEAGGVCEAKYGNFIVIYFLFIPILNMILLGYLLIVCKRSGSWIENFSNFNQKKKKTAKSWSFVAHVFVVIGFSLVLKYIAFSNYDTRTVFVPGEYLSSFWLMQIFHFAFFGIVLLSCGVGTYTQLKNAKKDDSIRHET